jgi:hypothetical protein
MIEAGEGGELEYSMIRVAAEPSTTSTIRVRMFLLFVWAEVPRASGQGEQTKKAEEMI